MQLNFTVLGIVAVLAIALIVFLIRRDRKDEKEFMDELNGTPTEQDPNKDDQYGL